LDLRSSQQFCLTVGVGEGVKFKKKIPLATEPYTDINETEFTVTMPF